MLNCFNQSFFCKNKTKSFCITFWLLDLIFSYLFESSINVTKERQLDVQQQGCMLDLAWVEAGGPV